MISIRAEVNRFRNFIPPIDDADPRETGASGLPLQNSYEMRPKVRECLKIKNSSERLPSIWCDIVSFQCNQILCKWKLSTITIILLQT
jgi:hypothetical protein